MGSGNAGRAIGAGYVLGMLIVPFREWTPAEPAQAAVRASSSTESAGTVRNPPGGPSGAESACAASLRRLTRRERKQKRLHAHTIAADLGAVGVGGGSSGAHPGVILTPEHHESCYRSLGHLPPLVTAQGARPGRTGRDGTRGAGARRSTAASSTSTVTPRACGLPPPPPATRPRSGCRPAKRARRAWPAARRVAAATLWRSSGRAR
mmetsp:Transcript_24351/g.76411  ORF Transcript_24351/g.76411 Transcript_24351/m.76411 type:complete len:207 (-) Transcript_24351:234-854(-)